MNLAEDSRSICLKSDLPRSRFKILLQENGNDQDRHG